MEKVRYEKIDGIRGIALLNMIAYHFAWDLVYLYHVQWEWYKSTGGYIWQQGICWTFIFLSGFCLPLGRHPAKRGIFVFIGGVVITVVTVIAMPSNRVVFGVLTLIGSCMIIVAAIGRWLEKIPSVLGVIGSVGLFVLTRNINEGVLGFEGLIIQKLPDVFYANLVTAYLGFPPHSFYSTDYFSLIPWIFLFLVGYFLSVGVKNHQWMSRMRKGWCVSIEWIGKHSLLIYMVHQPILYLILELLVYFDILG